MHAVLVAVHVGVAIGVHVVRAKAGWHPLGVGMAWVLWSLLVLALLALLVLLVIVGVVGVIAVATQILCISLVVVPDAKGFNIVVMPSTTIRIAKGFCGFLDLWKQIISTVNEAMEDTVVIALWNSSTSPPATLSGWCFNARRL